MASPYPSQDRFIAPKPNPFSNDIFSHDSPLLDDYKNSEYSQLIKKNLFGNFKLPEQ